MVTIIAQTYIEKRHSHNNLGGLDIVLDRFVRQNLTTVDIDLVLDSDVLSKNGDTLESSPFTNSRVPAHNGRFDPSVVLDLRVFQNSRSLDSDTVTNDTVRTNDDVRTDLTSLSDLGRWIDHWPHLDQIDHGWVQNVDTSVDSVTNEFDWLLDKSLDEVWNVSVVDNNTVFRWFIHLSGDNSGLTTMGGVEFEQIPQRVLTDDIGVENEDWGVVLLQDLLSELQRTSSSQRLLLNGEGDANAVLLLVLLEGTNHDFWLVVHRQNNVGTASVGQGLDLVQDHRSVTKLDQRFWQRQRQGSQTSTVTTNQD
ncbi:hypothetical protein OGATHE_006545 [Ogataea polymorpha]|uniref:Uncharacterized protein n=1 Tax=Ogataea polymorpha TaxID=460523 RepID=A0A9P8SY42_9ASCO|nr:hypothetical protein OGATHE_006545 [Ogataea polymorpha]